MAEFDSAVAVVPVSRAREEREGVERRYFTTRESRELAGRGARTVAGVLAAKAALCALCRAVAGRREYHEVDFVLSHAPDGSPHIVAVEGDPREVASRLLARLRVSISHTRSHAFGLAVCERESSRR